MNRNSPSFRKMLQIALGVLIVFAVLAVLRHGDILLQIIGFVLRLLTPFIIGLLMAFILNVILRVLEEKLFIHLDRRAKAGTRGGKVWFAVRRPLSVILTLILVLGLLIFVLFMVVPELTRTVDQLVTAFPGYLMQLESWINSFLALFGFSLDQLESFEAVDWNRISELVQEFVTGTEWGDLWGTAIGFTSSIFSGVVNFTLGFVFSIYILLTKEKLAVQSRAIAYAFLPVEQADRLIYIGRLGNNIFSRFIAGQVTEAVIIGTLCFIGMSILRMPFAPMISVLIGFTALIPVFGAFIGTGVGAFLILMDDPMKALGFILFIIVLQQFESNVIYPKVVGKSLGLPGLWVLLAVIIGGSLGGIMGMLLGVPIFSLLYALLMESTEKRLKKKNIGMDVPAGETAVMPEAGAAARAGTTPPAVPDDRKEPKK